MLWYTNPPRDLLQAKTASLVLYPVSNLISTCPPPQTPNISWTCRTSSSLQPPYSSAPFFQKNPLPTKPQSRPLLRTRRSARVFRLPPVTCNPILPKTRSCSTYLVFVMDLSVKLCSVCVWVCARECVCIYVCVVVCVLKINLKEPPLKDPAVKTPITLS